MKYLIFLTMLFTSSIVYSNEKKNNCESALAKLKPSCNFIGSSVENMKEFSKKNQTIGQTLGIEKKSLREFSEENKTIDQTLKNLGILKK